MMKPLYSDTGKKTATGNTEEIIRTVTDRYIKANPAEPLAYRAYTEDGFLRDASGCFDIDFDEIFPDAKEGDYAYAFAQYKMMNGLSSTFLFGSRTLTEIYVNGERVAKTTIRDELIGEDRVITVPRKMGYNTVFVKCKKDALGFGFRFGAQGHKGNPVEFYKAFAENAGELGWNYCGPFEKDIYPQPLVETLSMEDMEEVWLPRPYRAAMPNIEGHTEMYAVSTLSVENETEVSFCAEAEAEMELYIDGNLKGAARDRLDLSFALSEGVHAVAVRLSDKARFCSFSAKAEGAELALPESVKTGKGEWLYLDSRDERAKKGFDLYQLYDGYEPGEKTYFLCGEKTYLRPILETEQFGRLNYPNGVILYGLLEAGNFLKDADILEYEHNHLNVCYAPLELALWEMKKFGWPCVSHRMIRMNMLNDCGSFSAMVLEDHAKYHPDERVPYYAEHVADYILHKQERLENGMFYREVPGTYQELTIWADDIYMSIPFMIRYAQMTGDQSVMDDAVNQLLCCKEKLYMEEHKLLGHVYSLGRERCTRVPWGRGNGWVLFTLTEVLAVLPKNHKHYADIELFFRQLSEGFLHCVDKEGMIHQVLDDMDSFEEASATAMCAAAFARGVRMGILPAESYGESAERSAEALEKYCIDEDGNVYGVCRGSGYSFRRDYYKYDLNCRINDVHGTGIVLIALIEVEKNKRYLLQIPA
ncbi:MAG: glycoside hydrolase family 88 protein [Lachnospiraceae bacterium]|nr:glycoside hydrolase family 88 protein [Lachnospiraceae bacterium]